MKKIYTTVLYFSLALLLFSSCQEEIKWDVKEPQTLLVVDGQITNEFKNHRINLSKTIGLYDTINSIPVTNASISITDGNNIFQLSEIQGINGSYESTTAFSGIPGVQYTLNIELANPINGALHYEASDIMGYPFTFEDAYAYVERDFFISGTDTSYQMITYLYGKQGLQDEKYYLANFYKNDSIITDTITKAVIVNAKEWGTENEDIVPLVYSYHPEKFINDTLNFRLYSISKEYYEFLREVELSDEEPDPLGLSGPLANVKGNINNDGLGFFSAVAVEVGEFYVNDERE